ncbi:MAG TPA: biosynthetic-type acetolactate synthase large subunit [Firmicutes bacterium]|jgi:acetolactate synthase-1/2/3 large subunit|nr:biosynthetic-type acetolactate synthase large subunit [Bacillota bacterium]
MKLTGAEMVLACLEAENVDVVFGFPGGAVLTLYDEIYKKGLRHILSRHEQGAVHAADGYARASGRPGVVFATSGPGATNLVTGIATAYMDSIPLIIITGQVARPFIGTDAFQEADITGITLPITKHNYLVKRIEELPHIFKEAFTIATTGRQGPVLIDLPKDLQAEEGEFHYPSRAEIYGYRPTYEGHQGQIAKALARLRKAKKPLIYAGGGVVSSGAHLELLELSQNGAIPVTTTLTGMGSIPYDYELFLGMPGMHGTYAANHAINESDLLLTIGARFDDRVTGKIEHFAPDACIIHIDIDPAEIGKNIAVHIPIVGDVRMVLREMLRRFKKGETEKWCAKVKAWKAERPLRYKQEGHLKPQFVIEELNRLSGGEAIVATDVGQHQMWTAQYFQFNKPRTLLSSGGLGTMGYGFPAAIGAQVAFPDRLVVCIAGDGSFQMNSQELATVVHYQLPVKVAIINNQYLGMVRQWQKMFYEGRYSHTSMDGSPDFVRLAEAYGARGLRATAIEEVGPVIEEAFQSPGPVLMDFHVDPEENVLPMVAPNTSIVDMIGGEE